METTSIGIKIKSVCACVLSRECLNLSCLPKPSWSCRRHVGDMSLLHGLECLNNTLECLG